MASVARARLIVPRVNRSHDRLFSSLLCDELGDVLMPKLDRLGCGGRNLPAGAQHTEELVAADFGSKHLLCIVAMVLLQPGKKQVV